MSVPTSRPADALNAFRQWLERRETRRGVAAALLAALGAVTAESLLQAFDLQAPIFLLMVPAVLVASALGGRGAGLVATALGLGGGMFVGVYAGDNLLVAAVTFTILGVGVAILGGRLHTATATAQAVNDALRAREAHLRSILETVPDAMIVIDPKGIIQSFSAAAERLFRTTAANIVGRNISALMPQPYREAHDGYIERYLQTNERHIIGVGRVVVGERADGSTFPMELAVGEVRQGDLHQFTGFVRDLTERQATQKRLQELQSELVHISRLTAMGEMASSLAHELNQPLSAIANYLRGATRLLDQPGADVARLREPIEKATAQALRAGDVIRRLRNFVASGEAERKPESLAKMIEESLALALVGVRERSVLVRVRNTYAHDRVLADKVQIQQVLLNLIRNAVEALRGIEGSEVILEARAEPDGGALVRIVDSGPGIAPAIAERLFEPFMTTKKEGMGVGLSICRTIMEAHGGKLWHEETPGGGATFAFTLPRADGNKIDD